MVSSMIGGELSITHRAARTSGANKIDRLDDATGGGISVIIIDPAGTLMDLVVGQEPAQLG